MYTHHTKKGHTLIEMIVYVVILTVIFLIIVDAMILISGSYKRVKAVASIENSALLSFERMTRDIRTATSVDTGQSTLGSSPGKLVLNTNDSGGAALVLEYSLTSGVLHIKENGVDIGPVSDSNAQITSLIFQHLTSGTRTKAVKITMTIESGTGKARRVNNFSSTIVLRNSF